MAKAAARTPVATSAETLDDLDSDAPPAHAASDESAKTSDQMASGNTIKMSFSPPPRLIGPLVTDQPTTKHSASGARAAARRQNADAGLGSDMARG